MTDAAGQTTTFTYNSHGQILTITNPLDETTTIIYGTDPEPTATDG
jgi:YD repeat-containing protein